MFRSKAEKESWLSSLRYAKLKLSKLCSFYIKMVRLTDIKGPRAVY